jgi:hypothetical protein
LHATPSLAIIRMITDRLVSTPMRWSPMSALGQASNVLEYIVNGLAQRFMASKGL